MDVWLCFQYVPPLRNTCRPFPAGPSPIALDPVFKQRFHLCRALILIMASQRSLTNAFWKQCCCLNRCCHTHWPEAEDISVFIRGHDIITNFVTPSYPSPGISTMAFPEVCIRRLPCKYKSALITVWYNIPEYCRCSFSDIFACIVLCQMFPRCWHSGKLPLSIL